MIVVLNDPHETNAEREERTAALFGAPLDDGRPDDIEWYDDDPEASRRCDCGWALCGECMRRGN